MKLFKKITAVILLVLMLLPAFTFASSAKQVTVKADGMNVTRGSGFLVIYTSEHGDTTATNEWGYEVVIENNKAVKFNKGNSTIPANGFVLSGHDEGEGGKNMGTWIQENIKIGDYVYYTATGVVTVSDEPIQETVFYELSQKILGVNVVRQTDSIVIYNKRGTHTGTNDWGYEVVCTNGVVVALGGNNNQVPHSPDSFVVSGHGAAVTWLQNNVKLGMSVSYDEAKKTVTFSYDEGAAIAGMELCLGNLWTAYNEALERFDNFDYVAAKAAIDKIDADANAAKKAYKETKDKVLLSERSKAREPAASDAMLLISESKTVEYRGVWIRPTDTSAAQVEETVQKLYEQGINLICVETLYDCTMIMPMPKDSLFETNPKFRKFDLLQSYIDSCHQRGMELHLWMPIFYVGDAGSSNARYSVGNKKKEWLSLANTGIYAHQVNGELGSLMMLDPANEEACNYLLSTYKYILEKYDVDGFQLDYIRYYTRTAEYDLGYNDTALDAFEEKYGVRPKYDTKASYWKDWVAFRCNYIDSFVQRVRKLIDEVKPDVLLGADVVPDPTDSVDNNYQNYYTWLENKWIDILFPMSYGYGYEEDIADQTVRCGENAFIAVGLGIFMTELTPEDMQIQAAYNTSVNADGSVYFEASAFNKKETGALLLKGVHREKAMTPTFDIEKAAKAQAEYMKSRISNVILPLGAITEENANTVIAAIDALSATLTDKSFDTAKYTAVSDAIAAANLEDAAAKRLKSDLKTIVKAYSVANKELDLSGVPETPDNPDYSEKPDNESKGGESTASEAESEAGTDESDAVAKKSNGGQIVIVIVCVIVIIGCAVTVILVSKKGKK
ncbi:MAG: family 10 glycosylhydrolase [Clostridia bacterium]|nr:family 10 glycosylhydrolase [Clostridia bacterium]